MSFLTPKDLMLAIRDNPKTAWIFPVLIDTTLAVCILMLAALGGKPGPRVVFLSRLAPTLIFTAGFDPLRDGGSSCAAKLTSIFCL